MNITIELLHAAAVYVTKHPEATAEQVGAFVGKSKRTIERWSTYAEWHDALDNLGFEGDRHWRREPQRDVQRDDGDILDLAKKIYLRHRGDGYKKGESLAIAARTVNKTARTIMSWRDRFKWE